MDLILTGSFPNLLFITRKGMGYIDKRPPLQTSSFRFPCSFSIQSTIEAVLLTSLLVKSLTIRDCLAERTFLKV